MMKNPLFFKAHSFFANFMLYALVLLTGAQVSAQYEIVYENHEPELTQPWAIADDGLNNSYLAGNFELTLTLGSFTLTSAQNTNGFVGKFNSSSNTWLWAKKITHVSNGTGQQTWNNFSQVFDIVIDNGGNVYVTGNYSGVISFDNITLSSTKQGNQHTPDIFVAKYNTSGGIVWAKSFGSKAGLDMAKMIALDGSNNVFIGGVFTNKVITCNGQAADRYDVYLAKLNNAGTALWQKRYAANPIICGPNNSGESLCTDASGNVFLAGTFAGTLSFGSGPGLTITSTNGTPDVFAAKINGAGTTQWVRSAGGTSTDNGLAILPDAAGNVYVGGKLATDGFISKYNATGSIVWSVIPFPYSEEWFATSIKRILPYAGSLLVTSGIGFKTIATVDGSVLTSDTLFSNPAGYPAPSIFDVAVAGSGYVFNVMLNCGTVTIGSTALLAANDCPFNGNDFFIVRTGETPPAFQTNNDITDPLAAVQVVAENEIEVYPNPASGELHVILPEREDETTLFIQNQFGRTVWSEKFETQRRTATISLDGQNFQSGIYYLVYLSNDEVLTKQLVIDKE